MEKSVLPDQLTSGWLRLLPLFETGYTYNQLEIPLITCRFPALQLLIKSIDTVNGERFGSK